MQAQISFYDLNLESNEKRLNNVVKFPAKKTFESLKVKSSDKPKPQAADSVKTLEEIEKNQEIFSR